MKKYFVLALLVGSSAFGVQDGEKIWHQFQGSKMASLLSGLDKNQLNNSTLYGHAAHSKTGSNMIQFFNDLNDYSQSTEYNQDGGILTVKFGQDAFENVPASKKWKFKKAKKEEETKKQLKPGCQRIKTLTENYDIAHEAAAYADWKKSNRFYAFFREAGTITGIAVIGAGFLYAAEKFGLIESPSK